MKQLQFLLCMGLIMLIPSLYGQVQRTQQQIPQFVQQPLPYDYKALEPYIDAQTMEIHYTRHHAVYTKGLNEAIAAVAATQFVPADIETILAQISKYPVAVRNNGGGYYNHQFFWSCMTPGDGGEPTGKLKEAIIRDFGSFAVFKEAFSKAATTRFGSGWAWLVSQNDKLSVGSTPNQDNPLMDISDLKGTPILCLDVWEHAYYLKYQNKRPDYIQAFWKVVNWKQVEAWYELSLQ